MMKYAEKVSRPSSSSSSKLKQMQKSLLEPKSIGHNKTEYEATADIGVPLLSYNLVNIPAYPPVQRKEPEDEELQMKPSESCPECEGETIQVTISVGCAAVADTDRTATEVLKRVDEKHVTEVAYGNPKFVEDVSRDLIVGLRELGGQLDEVSGFQVRVENAESIHYHNAYAVTREARNPLHGVCDGVELWGSSFGAIYPF